jgi:ATP phosphoribosyltransferase regulatory subunit HisZ
MVEAELQRMLAADAKRLREINRFLVDPSNELVGRLLDTVERFGGPEEINRKAEQARALPNLLRRLDEIQSPYRADLDWLIEQRDKDRNQICERKADNNPGC